MTIRPNVDWGEPLGAVPGIPVADDDHTLARLLAAGVIVDPARRPDLPGPARFGVAAPVTVALTGGELWRFLGGPAVAGRWSTPAAWRFPVDLLAVEIDGTTHWAAATVTATTSASRWGRPLAVAGNVGTWRGYRALPRAHPNDGLVDAVWGDLPWRELAKVRQRAVTGTHLPHPGLTERRRSEVTIDTGRMASWSVDGVAVGRASAAVVTVVPDAGIVVL